MKWNEKLMKIIQSLILSFDFNLLIDAAADELQRMDG